MRSTHPTVPLNAFSHYNTERHKIKTELVNAIQAVKNLKEEYVNKRAYQSIMDFGTGKCYLVRVIVDDTVAIR